MDILSNKAVLIGAGLLITLVIMSSVILGISKIGEIYGITNKTEVDLAKEFASEFDMYDSSVMNGLDLINTIKKYENNNRIIVEYPGKADIQIIVNDTGAREVDVLKKKIKEANEDPTIVYTNKYETNYDVIVSDLKDSSNIPKIEIRFKAKF